MCLRILVSQETQHATRGGAMRDELERRVTNVSSGARRGATVRTAYHQTIVNIIVFTGDVVRADNLSVPIRW